MLRERSDLTPENLARTKTLMNLALADANVTDHERLIDSFELPDPNDRHVLAAAVRIGAQAIVTFNLDHFPASALEPTRESRSHVLAPLDRLAEQLHTALGDAGELSLSCRVLDGVAALRPRLAPVMPPLELRERQTTALLRAKCCAAIGRRPSHPARRRRPLARA